VQRRGFGWGITVSDLASPVIRTPDQRLRVFISSTLKELGDERVAARDAVQRLHLAPVLFEVGARPHPARDLYRAYLDQSHIFIGIYWQQYGWVAPDETVSGLEDEYRLSGDKPKLIYIKSPAPDREERLKGMIDSIRGAGDVSYKYFTSATELGELIEHDLMLLLTERFETPPDRRPAVNATPGNLPISLDRFVGRQHELEEVKDRLGGTRLLTLVGTGGTGKTRLALQAATELHDDFEGRVYFVDLAACRDLDSLLSVTARAIGLREERDRPLLDDLKGQIGDERILLLLDNFEQVTVAGPAMAELIRQCPELKLLVTSREALRVKGEVIFQVPPLPLPQAGLNQGSIDQLAQSEAVQLFVERAQAVKPDFRLSDENARAVAELCVRLDGLPLAIELATARLGIFSPQALVERLGNRLKLLRSGALDLPLRQQTLYDTIDWSYGMLDPSDKRLFELISVFAGATLEAIDAVAGLANGLEQDVIDALSSLVDKSLIRRVEQPGADSRFVMLETIREFAAARLEDDPAWSASTRHAHATHFADWTRSQHQRLVGEERESASDQMAADIENIRTAWRFWASERDFDQLGKLTDSLWLLYDARGWYHATVSLATDLLDLLSSAPVTGERALDRITLQTSLARVLLALKGYTQEVEDAYTRTLELCEGRGEIPELLPVLRGLSSFYLYRAEFEKAARIGEQILNLSERNNDASLRVEGHVLLGANLALLNDLKSGLDHLEKGIAAYDPERPGTGRFQLGNNPGVVCLSTSALLLWMLGFPDRARERANEAIALSKRLNHPSSMAYAEFHAGLIRLWIRENDLAYRHAQTALEIAEHYEFQIWMVVGSCLRGAALAGLGSADEGLVIIEQAMKSYQRLNTPPVFWPMLLYLQAGVCRLAARPADGLVLIDEAIEITARTSGKTLMSEFFQIKGDLLLTLSSDASGEAEAWYKRALDTAAEVQAPMLQLRAALRLARLWRDRGEAKNARQLLSEAYDRFTEGFETADLREAEGLLEAIEVGSKPASSPNHT
jgi:predicted ATPase